MYRRLGWTFLIAVACAGSISATQSIAAQSPSSSRTDRVAPDRKNLCFDAAEQLAKDKIESFLKEPDGLLKAHPDAGLPLSNDVRALVGSDDRTLDVVLHLSSKANSNQRAAIAAGLARTIAACGTAQQQDYISRIQTSVAKSGDKTMITAFQQASADIEVSAVNAGQANASGGGAVNVDSTKGGQNSLRYSDSPVKNTSGVYTFGSAGNFLDQGNVSRQ